MRAPLYTVKFVGDSRNFRAARSADDDANTGAPAAASAAEELHESDVPYQYRLYEVQYCKPPTRPESSSAEAGPSEQVQSSGDYENPSIPSSALETELGVSPDEPETFITSLLDCSCQLPRCSGLPCRHQIAIWNRLTAGATLQQINYFNVVKLTIAELWLKSNNVEEAVRAHRLDLLRRNCMSREDGGSSSGAKPTKAELVQYAFKQMRPFVEAMATSEDNINQMISHIVKFKDLVPSGSCSFPHTAARVQNSTWCNSRAAPPFHASSAAQAQPSVRRKLSQPLVVM
jgi:hypothetical protein